MATRTLSSAEATLAPDMRKLPAHQCGKCGRYRRCDYTPHMDLACATRAFWQDTTCTPATTLALAAAVAALEAAHEDALADAADRAAEG